MTLKSMTGFARADGSHGPAGWHWEVRSVNARGLDVRMRLAQGFEGLEPRVREIVGRHVTRGSVAVNLNVRRADGIAEVRLNETILEQVLAASRRVSERIGGAPPRAEALLALRGVLEFVEPVESEAMVEARDAAMLASLEQALAGVVAARTGEGARLAKAIEQHLDEVERAVGTIADHPSRAPEAVARRLREQIMRIMEAGPGLDEQRLAQEALLLATRADVEEEVKRLAAHVAAARELLTAREPVGRRLDFLAQEFNREANTLCSKANDTGLTRIGLALKATIDQMREQVQNIE